MVRKLLASYRKRVKARPDSEHTQAMLRLGIVWLLIFYTSWVVGHDPASGAWLWSVNAFSIVCSLGLFAHILRNPGASPRRRVLGAVHDNVAVTLWLHQAGPLGALYLFVYPFVTVGNGFRFGVKYLVWSGFMGAAGISVLVTSAPDWQHHQVIGSGVLLSHVLVTGYIGVLLTRMQRMQVELETMATYDILTGLPNRRLFMDKLTHVLAGRHRGNVACLYLDLDGFKAVNDRGGHEAGDRLLKLVAERVTGCIRLSDMPARLGGDEFAVVLDRLTSSDDARIVAERIIKAIESIEEVDGNPVRISASVGIAFLPAGEVDVPWVAEGLVRSADAAMYDAKKSAKGQYKFVDVMAERRAGWPDADAGWERRPVGAGARPVVPCLP